MRFDVTNAPWWARPLVALYGYSVGPILWSYIAVLHATSRITVVGAEYARLPGSTIFCFWHQRLWLFFAVHLRLNAQAQLNHPMVYMKPIHVALRMVGVRLLFGSTGHGGRAAADELLACLQKGMSTTMNPDGPYGPPRVAKKGLFHLARKSGAPIVAIRLECARAFQLSGWDQKLLPLPFNHFTVTYLPPVYVTSDDFADALVEVTRDLG